MKTKIEIANDIKANIKSKSNINVASGTIIDMFCNAVSDSIYKAYEEIEDSRNPFLYSQLTGYDLDNLGANYNLFRYENESDQNFLYRIMNWFKSLQKSNLTAIENALLSLTYASNAEYEPKTHGTGTGTVFIIPKDYSEETINLAIEEAKQRLADVISPSVSVDYRIPTVKKIKFIVYLDAPFKDKSSVQNALGDKIKNYVNSVATGKTVEIGEINRIGLSEPGVEYFNVVQSYINDQVDTSIDFLQTLESKILFEGIVWLEVK